MKKLLVMCAIGLFVSRAAVASADTIGPGYVSGTIQGIIDLGFGGDGSGDPDEQLDALNEILTAYNAANDPDLDAPATFGTNDIIDFVGTPTSIALTLLDFDYIKLKWDGKWQYYYIGDADGEITFQSTAFNKGSGAPQGLSHYTYFSPSTNVPDGGSTAALLGSVLFAFGVLRRRYGKN